MLLHFHIGNPHFHIGNPTKLRFSAEVSDTTLIFTVTDSTPEELPRQKFHFRHNRYHPPGERKFRDIKIT